MRINTLVGLVNTKLAGETLTYAQCQPLFDEVITEINTHLNACFPLFSTYAPSLTDLTAEYDCFPEQYLVSVVVTGAAYKFYTIDEEGIAVAQGYGTDYQSALFFMVRDYSRQVPEKYQANGRGYISASNSGAWLHNVNDMFSMSCSAEEEGFQPAIRYTEGPRGLPGQSIVGPAGDFYKLEVHDNKVYAVRYTSTGELVEHALKILICDLADLKGETGPKGDKGDGANITVDSEMSDTSTNPVQNKVAKKYMDNTLLSKLSWQPHTKYEVGQTVIDIREDISGVPNAKFYICRVAHTSSSTGEFMEEWDMVEVYDSMWAEYAKKDEEGNLIHETYATKEELESFAAKEEVYDYSSEVTKDLVLEHNSLYYFDELTELTLTVSADINLKSVTEPFECSILFKTKDNPLVISQDGITITWSGDDCSSDGVFNPEPNKTYEISIKKLGLIVSARVGVV